MNYAEKLFKGSSVVLIMHAIAGVIAYGLRLFLARSLTVSDFGLLYAVLSFIGLLTLFRDFGFGPTLAKYIAEFNARKDYKSIKSSVIIVTGIEVVAGLVWAAIIFYAADWLSLNYFKAPAAETLKILIVSFALSGFFALQFVFQGLERMKEYTAIEPLRNLITLAASFFFIGLGMGVAGVAYGYLVASVVLPVIIFLMILRVFPFFNVKSKIFDKGLAKKLTKFSFFLLFAGLGGTIIGYIDTIAITYFLSVKDVGLYQVALPTSQILWTFVSSVTIVMLPMASSLWAKGDRKTLSKIAGFVTKFSFILVIPFVIVIMTFPDFIIRTLFGESYAAAAPTLQILALTSLFYVLFHVSSTLLLAIGEPKRYMYLYIFLSLFVLVLNIGLVPLFGILGAAYATLASYLVSSVFGIFYLKGKMDFKLHWTEMVKAFAGGVLAFAVFMLVKDAMIGANPWIKIIASSAVGGTFYLVYLYATRTVTKEEMKILGKLGLPVPGFILRLFDRL